MKKYRRQSFILPLHFKQGRGRPLSASAATMWRSEGIPQPYADLSLRQCGEGTAASCISLVFYWQHAEALNPDLNPQDQDRVRALCFRIKDLLLLRGQMWKQKKKIRPVLRFYLIFRTHHILTASFPFYGGKNCGGEILIIPNVNILLWNGLRLKH